MTDSLKDTFDAAAYRAWLERVPHGAVFVMPGSGGIRENAVVITKDDVRLALAEIDRLTDELNDRERRLRDIDYQVAFLGRIVSEGGNSDEFKEGALYALKEIRRYVPHYEGDDD